MREQIEREVDRTLACFDRTEKIGVDPYFYVRVMGKILAQEQRERNPASWLPGMSLLRPVFPIAIIVFNMVVVALVFKSGVSDAGSRETRLCALAERYSLNQNAYDFFPVKNGVQRWTFLRKSALQDS